MIYTCGIVEDEPLAEKMLRKYIGRMSFFRLAWSCAFAEEAVPLLQKQPVDLLFLDVQEAPLRRGTALFDVIKKFECNIVVTSPYPREAVASNLGVVAFLTKPVSFDRFLEATETFLEAREQ